MNSIAYKLSPEFWDEFRTIAPTFDSIAATIDESGQCLVIAKDLYFSNAYIRRAIALKMRSSEPAPFPRSIEIDGDWIVITTGRLAGKLRAGTEQR